MAAKEKQKQKTRSFCTKTILISCCMVLSTLIVYLWSLYDRLLKREHIQKKTRWPWYILIPAKDEEIDFNKLLVIVQEDLDVLYISLVKFICIFIPRETTSIISAVILFGVIITLTITKYYSAREKKEVRQEKVSKVSKKNYTNEVYYDRSFFQILTSLFIKEKTPRESGGVSEDGRPNRTISLKSTSKRLLLLLLFLTFLVSIPFEYVRLFQIEVAKRVAVMGSGVPKECNPDAMTITQSIRYWLLLQLSWQHDPCEKYHKALLVDPLWEITPLFVVSSLITRSLLHPIEIFFSGIGKSFKLFFSEIPAQWQPVMMIAMTILLMMTVMMFFGYRISFPMILKIEPKTPVCEQRRTSAVKNSDVEMSDRKKLDYHG